MVIEMNGHSISDEFIDLCYKTAETSLASGEVPVGCIFVQFSSDHPNGHVLVTGHNRTNVTRNATRHAEMECIDKIVAKFGSQMNKLHEIMAETTVLLTLEPCLMCVRALRYLRPKQVLFGARNDRFGGNESVYNVSTNELISDPKLMCYQLLSAKKSIDLLQRFYKQTNESAPKPHRKRLKTSADDSEL
ncbi:tRNA-specific adenosine deaminase 2-like [Oppia nitens]|uniref:tRNA-specific adenosine deaminase 2-like n=1 Tax=Oppia nitens TaxID=1686743 RepID=UPI0023DA8E72|nr:tRNA-specific adenosine deaminase 2-like [Oppia nitens]